MTDAELLAQIKEKGEELVHLICYARSQKPVSGISHYFLSHAWSNAARAIEHATTALQDSPNG